MRMVDKPSAVVIAEYRYPLQAGKNDAPSVYSAHDAAPSRRNAAEILETSCRSKLPSSPPDTTSNTPRNDRPIQPNATGEGRTRRMAQFRIRVSIGVLAIMAEAERAPDWPASCWP